MVGFRHWYFSAAANGGEIPDHDGSMAREEEDRVLKCGEKPGRDYSRSRRMLQTTEFSCYTGNTHLALEPYCGSSCERLEPHSLPITP